MLTKVLRVLREEGLRELVTRSGAKLLRCVWVGEALAFQLRQTWAARRAPRRAAAGPRPPVRFGDKVAIVIPFRDMPALLRPCVESVLAKTDYPCYELVLVDNQSSLPETRAYLASLSGEPRITLLRYDAPFNYAALHNWVVPQLTSELVLLLNNDTEVITSAWLGELVKRLEAPDVGAVGALLLYGDGTVQHAGVCISLYRSPPYHVFRGASLAGKRGRRILSPREYSAVTGACLLTRRSLYRDVGGLDAESFAVNLNDIDYCLKLRELGYRILYAPEAQLYHHESRTRGSDYGSPAKLERAEREWRRFDERWRKYRNADPCFMLLDDV